MAVPPIVAKAATDVAVELTRQVAGLYAQFIEAKREETRLRFQRYVEDMARFEKVFAADAEVTALKIKESFALMRELLAQGEHDLAAALHQTVIRDTSLTRLLIEYHRQVTGAAASRDAEAIELKPLPVPDGS